MDEFAKLALGTMADLDQVAAGVEAGDESKTQQARKVLTRLIEVSDGPKLLFLIRAIGMVAAEAVKKAR